MLVHQNNLTVTFPKQAKQANDFAKNSCCHVINITRNVDVSHKKTVGKVSVSERKPGRVRSDDIVIGVLIERLNCFSVTVWISLFTCWYP